MIPPLRGGYGSLAELDAELTLYRVSGQHEERSEWLTSPVLHEGYVAFRCARCGTPTLRAKGRVDVVTCGFGDCNTALQQNVYREPDNSDLLA